MQSKFETLLSSLMEIMEAPTTSALTPGTPTPAGTPATPGAKPATPVTGTPATPATPGAKPATPTPSPAQAADALKNFTTAFNDGNVTLDKYLATPANVAALKTAVGSIK